MTRDPELDKAIRDLQPVYASMRKYEADLKRPEVYENLSVQSSVQVMAADRRADIATRADAIGMDFDVLLAILGTIHSETKRVGRNASIRQIGAALSRRASGFSRALPTAEQEATDAAKRAAEVRARALTYSAACQAVTGYSN